MKNYKNIIKKFNKFIGFDTKILKKYNAFIAGGAILSALTEKEINDFDIYFKSKDDFIDFYDFLQDEGYYCVNETLKSLILVKKNHINVNLMFFNFFESPDDIFESFDFTVCMGAYDGEDFYFSETCIQDVCRKKLIYNPNTRYPIASLLRIKKYNDKGYKVDKNEYLKMILNSSKSKINSFNDLLEEIGGVYGIEDMSEAFPELKTDFSIDKFISKIDEIDFDYDFVKNKTKDIGIPNIIKNNLTYIELYDNSYVSIDGSFYFYEDEGTPQKVLNFPIFGYKWVDENKRSFFEKNIEYVMGEYLEDKSDHGFNFFIDINKSLKHHYSNRDGAILIKLIIEQSDHLKCDNDEFSATKCLPICVVGDKETVIKNIEGEK